MYCTVYLTLNKVGCVAFAGTCTYKILLCTCVKETTVTCLLIISLKQLLNKQGCKTTSSCYSAPPSCMSSNDCDYLLKYSLDGKNVIFELSSKTYEWVAVGFNDKKAMVLYSTL